MKCNDRAGWSSDLPRFQTTPASIIRGNLEAFVREAGARQIRAWDDSIPVLQEEAGEILSAFKGAEDYTAILEYQLPMELRRPDVIVLADGVIVVLELKGKFEPSQADIDQTAAYARDLRCYHQECHDRPVLAICVPMRANGYLFEKQGIHVAGPDYLDQLILSFRSKQGRSGPKAESFLDESAYRPLPTLVQSARELFNSGKIRNIHRAHAATEPAVESLVAIVHEAARTCSRHLVLLSGVPGAGKTLVGLRIVHADFLDDLAVERVGRKPSSPAVFLSGNGPLVEVLQYELRSAGGGGTTFIRGVMPYLQRYIPRPELVPPEHVIVFDEAQRAFDSAMILEKHAHLAGFEGSKSEPDLIIEIADRIPDWCVVVGLIGSGQEIHVGEEGGIGQWKTALENSGKSDEWTVHCPPGMVPHMAGPRVELRQKSTLNLDTELRFHLAPRIHEFVAKLLGGAAVETLKEIAQDLEAGGYHLRISRSMEVAKAYLHERYSDHPEARYGLLASSKDRDLLRFGVPNDFQSTKNVKVGPWYGDDEGAAGNRSCRHLIQAVTEFSAQGLELDGVLLAWGTDFMRTGGRWSNARARGYMKGKMVKDPFQLRVNAYRVLLTRGRDGTIVFVPPLYELDETWNYLVDSGFRDLQNSVF
ncbi:MAG: DUF2075 domain-containing protein [Spirochaetaceae bacterium]|nr:DUF2075 domain-containing protein [Spirochaetaceae bacterium]